MSEINGANIESSETGQQKLSNQEQVRNLLNEPEDKDEILQIANKIATEDNELELPDNQTESETPDNPNDSENNDLAAKGKEKDPVRVGAVDVKELNEELAGFYADKETTEKLNAARGQKGFKGVMGRMYWRVFERNERLKAINKYREKIGNGELENNEEFIKDKQEVLQRILADSDEPLRYGDTREEANEEFNNSVKGLIKDYISGNIDKEAFEEAKFELLQGAYSGDRKAMFRKEDVVDNLLEFAENIKASENHDKALAELDKDFKAFLGKAQGVFKTESEFGNFEKFVNTIQESKILASMFEPASIGIAAGAIYSVGTFFVERLARSNAAKISTLGASTILGFGYGALRKNTEVKRDFRMHVNEMAAGGEITPGSKGREKMEQFRVETRDSKSSTAEIFEILEAGELSPEQKQALTEKIVDLKARIEASDENNEIYLSFTDILHAQRERNALDEAIASAEVRLKADGGKEENDKFAADLRSQINAAKEKLGEELAQKQGQFSKYKAIEVTKSGLTAAAFAGFAGLAIHEVADLVGDNDFTSFFHKTLFSIEGDKTLGTDGSIVHEVALGESGTYKMPDGFDLIKNQDGTVDLVNLTTQESVVDHIMINPDGTLTDESAELIKKQGIELISGHIEGSGETVSYSDVEAVSNRPEFERVFRAGWDDENTPGVTDLNEGKLMFGGIDGTGIDSDGNFVFDVSSMTSDGSFHGDISDDYAEAIKNHKLFLNLSLSEETQRYMASVEFNENGQAIIPKDSPLAQMFFENHDGHAVFKGRFAEVAHVIGGKVGNDGQIHDLVRMLATAEGHGVDNVNIAIPDAYEYTLEIPKDSEFYVPIMPFNRKPLENMGKKAQETPEPEGPQPITPVEDTDHAGTGENQMPSEDSSEQEIQNIGSQGSNNAESEQGEQMQSFIDRLQAEQEESSSSEDEYAEQLQSFLERNAENQEIRNPEIARLLILRVESWVNKNISKEDILERKGRFAEFIKRAGFKNGDFEIIGDRFVLKNVLVIMKIIVEDRNKNIKDQRLPFLYGKNSDTKYAEQMQSFIDRNAAEQASGDSGSLKSEEELQGERMQAFIDRQQAEQNPETSGAEQQGAQMESFINRLQEEQIFGNSNVRKTEEELQGERMQSFIDRNAAEQASGDSGSLKSEEELQGERMQAFIDRQQAEQNPETSGAEQQGAQMESFIERNEES